MGRLNKLKQVYSCFAADLIILGAVLLIRPDLAADLFCRICGILLILFGIARLFGYFSRDLLQLAFQFDFAMGIISCLLGVVMLFWSEQLMEILILGMGFFMLVDALLRIQTAIDARRIGVERWWLILIVSLVTAVTGALLLLRPYKGLEAVTVLIGLSLIIDGILNLYVVQTTVSIIRRSKKWQV